MQYLLCNVGRFAVCDPMADSTAACVAVLAGAGIGLLMAALRLMGGKHL
jgi:hypothetical protein